MRRNFIAVGITFALVLGAQADGFKTMDHPKVANLEARSVYGYASYDFSFTGKNNASRSQSASNFLRSLIQSRFQNKSGNYIITLDVLIQDKLIATEPILSATWEANKFLFVTTSEKSSLVVNRNGILVDNVVVDGTTNYVTLSMKVHYSSTTSVDMSLLSELSKLSKTASLGGLSPGVEAISAAYAPFTEILNKLMSRYTDTSIVDSTTSAFTDMGENFPNQLRYDGRNFSVNVYLKTVNSQLAANYSADGFKISNFSLPLNRGQERRGCGKGAGV
ncbi:hypothetical protein NKJ36_27235 [Mesorhizobium sp. M0142]|uniref:hypothetical protein n=1 Tax=Mesorhizobium sp. M0142 TaxID=2956894 RepID=UPI0033354686